MNLQLLQSQLAKLNDFHNIQMALSETQRGGTYNQVTNYKVGGNIITYTHATQPDAMESLYMAFSSPRKNDNNVTAQVIRNHEVVIQKKVPPEFNQVFIYRDSFGNRASIDSEIGDLHEYWENNFGWLTLEEVKRLAAQLILSVYNYHSRSLAHGDIKDTNYIVYLINDKHFLKLADHDGVVEVDANGFEVKKSDVCMMSEWFISPEFSQRYHLLSLVPKGHIAQLKPLNRYASDCYAVGMSMGLLVYLLEEQECAMLAENTEGRPTPPRSFSEKTFNSKPIAKKEEKISVIIKKFLPPNTVYASFSELYHGLTNRDADARWTIHQALESTFFGEDHAARKNYFESIINEAKYDLHINNLLFDPYSLPMNDIRYLLPSTIQHHYILIKDIYHLVIELINTFSVALDFDSLNKPFQQYNLLAAKLIGSKTIFANIIAPNHAMFVKNIQIFYSMLYNTSNELNFLITDKLKLALLQAVQKTIDTFIPSKESNSVFQGNTTIFGNTAILYLFLQEITLLKKAIEAATHGEIAHVLIQSYLQSNKHEVYKTLLKQNLNTVLTTPLIIEAENLAHADDEKTQTPRGMLRIN